MYTDISVYIYIYIYIYIYSLHSSAWTIPDDVLSVSIVTGVADPNAVGSKNPALAMALCTNSYTALGLLSLKQWRV